MAKKELGVSIIGPASHLEGQFSFQDNLRIEGSIHGELTVVGELVIAQTGSFKGKAKTGSAYIAGNFNGELFVTGKTILSAQSKLEGSLETGLLTIEEGAVLIGKCQMPEKQ
jgi:cytoskeletal protein CcmA (bactofilin family)